MELLIYVLDFSIYVLDFSDNWVITLSPPPTGAASFFKICLISIILAYLMESVSQIKFNDLGELCPF